MVLFWWMIGILLYSAAHIDNPARAADVRRVLHPSEDCPQPCWLGIRPGLSSTGEAIDILKTLPWVTGIYTIQGVVTYDTFVGWKWSGQQPALIDSVRDGRMWTHNGVVYLIELPLEMSYAEMWNAFAAPETVNIMGTSLKPPAVFYFANYFRGALEAFSTVNCPLTAWNILAARVDVHIADPSMRGQPMNDKASTNRLC